MLEPEQDLSAFVDQAAMLIGLPIPAEYRQEVIDNFERIGAIAQLVTEFPLPEDTEIAPIFEP
ncbi:DUF4089 domain-containing protein [Phormidium sp. CLA17]|uniref:DUF4089 domain-containing protein n=1 Tax=Leptolyngbya sp. Cla-17 TaxID=2803751 RepID=UPI001492A967|nr:DUF4089 domain-containing protein [Leptolyngbya sp. Cla-17]MBM0743203.1 DUF4089 domain-containing protein [Leptolyngbya sp. Cla-17]